MAEDFGSKLTKRVRAAEAEPKPAVIRVGGHGDIGEIANLSDEDFQRWLNSTTPEDDAMEIAAELVALDLLTESEVAAVLAERLGHGEGDRLAWITMSSALVNAANRKQQRRRLSSGA